MHRPRPGRLRRLRLRRRDRPPTPTPAAGTSLRMNMRGCGRRRGAVPAASTTRGSTATSSPSLAAARAPRAARSPSSASRWARTSRCSTLGRRRERLPAGLRRRGRGLAAARPRRLRGRARGARRTASTSRYFVRMLADDATASGPRPPDLFSARPRARPAHRARVRRPASPRPSAATRAPRVLRAVQRGPAACGDRPPGARARRGRRPHDPGAIGRRAGRCSRPASVRREMTSRPADTSASWPRLQAPGWFWAAERVMDFVEQAAARAETAASRRRRLARGRSEQTARSPSTRCPPSSAGPPPVGMDAVGLVERAIAGHALEQERHERRAVAFARARDRSRGSAARTRSP